MTSPRKVWYAPNMKQAYDEEEIEAVRQCLEEGWLSHGPRAAEFEQLCADYFGKKFGVFVNSGSSANLIACICAGIEPGIEVITPACTFSTTVSPLVQLGAIVKFCDVELNRYVPSPEQILSEITEKTKVILIPNLIGNKPDWKIIKESLNKIGRSDIILLEDSCDTMTYTFETDISTTSFYASHIITAGGSGGMVMFNDRNLYNRALRLRDWGRVGGNDEGVAARFNHGLLDDIQYDWKFIYSEFGYNFKACEMNAAFGLIQIKKLKKFEEIRKNLLNHYFKRLTENEFSLKYYQLPIITEGQLLLALPLSCNNRMEILEFLENNNIQTRVAMAGNILKHPIYNQYFNIESLKNFPNSDLIMNNSFLIGCHHGLNLSDIDYVCDLLIQFSKKKLQ